VREERGAGRPYVIARVKIKPLGRTPSIDAVAINMSRRGIGVYVTEPIKKGAEVSLNLTFYDGKGFRSTENMRGTVRWVLEFGGQYAAGIEFVAPVLKQDRPIFYDCLEQAKRNG